MSLLLQEQQKFSVMLSNLIIWISAHDHKVVIKEVLRTQTEAAANANKGTGIIHSLHCLSLAADLAIFDSMGKYLQDTKDYEFAGKYWESLGGSWGGRFKTNPDGNHFSLAYQGVR